MIPETRAGGGGGCRFKPRIVHASVNPTALTSLSIDLESAIPIIVGDWKRRYRDVVLLSHVGMRGFRPSPVIVAPSYDLWQRTYSARNIAPLTTIMAIPTLMSRLSVLAASAPASRAIAAASNRTYTLVTEATS